MQKKKILVVSESVLCLLHPVYCVLARCARFAACCLVRNTQYGKISFQTILWKCHKTTLADIPPLLTLLKDVSEALPHF